MNPIDGSSTREHAACWYPSGTLVKMFSRENLACTSCASGLRSGNFDQQTTKGLVELYTSNSRIKSLEFISTIQHGSIELSMSSAASWLGTK